MSSTPLCIFHKNCLDGRASAAVVKKKEGKVEFRPLAYNTDFKLPSVVGRKVYVVDFALPADDMRRIAREASELIWLDHHETSVPLHAELGFGTVNQEECGATLTWHYCFPDQALPDVLAYVRDKDLWQWQLPDSKAIVAGLEDRFSDTDFAQMLSVDLKKMHKRGEPLVNAIRKKVKRAGSRGVPVTDPYGLRDIRALVVNDLGNVSDLGDHICLPTERGGLGYDLAICFTLRRDGMWIHSLRSGSKVDCAAVALNRGGGGHPNAASYIAKVPFPVSDDCLDWPV